MTNMETETRNGWGPAAPASDSREEPEARRRDEEYEDEAVEEIGGEEGVEADNSDANTNGASANGRRVYTGSEQEDARGGDSEGGSADYEDGASQDDLFEEDQSEEDQSEEDLNQEEEEPEEEEEKPEEEDDEVEEFGHPSPQQQPHKREPNAATTNHEQADEGDDEAPEEFDNPSSRWQQGSSRMDGDQSPQDRNTGSSEYTRVASNGKKDARHSSRPRGQTTGRSSQKRQPEDHQPQEPQPQESARAEHAFDPDEASSVENARQGSGNSPERQPASYGSFGAGRIRRSLARLPVAGKLFGPGSRSAPRSAFTNRATDGGHGAGEGRSRVRDGATSHEQDQGIAAKPSPQEVERRLALALRETSIDGFSKIAVGSPKGGVGKSSLAYAIGCAIANHTNIRVCLVDADPEFGATRSLVPRPVPYSIVDLARDADDLHRLSDIRGYVAQNEQMRLDVVLNPSEMIQKANIGDLPTAYGRIDEALSRFYDLVIYDMGIGFSHPQIQKILSLSDELLLVGDSEVVPNDIFADALSYIQGLGIGLDHATLAISHRLPPTDESATTGLIKSEHARKLRRVTEIPYDAAFSQLLNRRAFRVDALSLDTRLGILTTAAASLEGLRGGVGTSANANTGPRKKG